MPISSSEVQEALQPACCYNQCPPLHELEDNQFLAVVYNYLIAISFVNPVTDASAADIQEAAKDAWCELNMSLMCSIPADKLKAMILFMLQEQFPFDQVVEDTVDHIQEVACFNQCPPMWELEDNQYLALLYWFLSDFTTIDPTEESASDIQEAAFNAWCQFNMVTLPSVANDKVKALSVYIISTQL